MDGDYHVVHIFLGSHIFAQSILTASILHNQYPQLISTFGKVAEAHWGW